VVYIPDFTQYTLRISTMTSTTPVNGHPAGKMTREELHTFADDFLKYINTPDANPEQLAKMVAPDVATPLFYPGMRSGYEGVNDILQKLHGALSDYSMQLVTPIIDADSQIVVYFVKSVGVQTGYCPPCAEGAWC